MQEQVLALAQRHLPGPFRAAGGGNYMTRCPFHKGGQEKSASFSISSTKAVFQCFTCKVKGSLQHMLHLLGVPASVVEMEISPLRPLIQRALEQERFEKKNAFFGRNPFEAQVVLPDSLLGVYEWMPMALVEQGYTPTLLQQMEVGYDRLNHRITYPIRDMFGHLAGIAGGATLPGQQPKYKVYQGRRKNSDGRWVQGDYGEWFDEMFPDYTFENHHHLWNFHRVFPVLRDTSDPSASLFIVEGYKACMWMVQAGYWNTVALMGSYVSERQKQMLQYLDVQVYLFLDNDRPGRRGTVWVGEELFRSCRRGLWVVPYIDDAVDTQPDDYLPEGIHHFVQNRRPFQEVQLEVLKNDPELLAQLQKRRNRTWQ